MTAQFDTAVVQKTSFKGLHTALLLHFSCIENGKVLLHYTFLKAE